MRFIAKKDCYSKDIINRTGISLLFALHLYRQCFSNVIRKNVSNVFTFVSFRAVCGRLRRGRSMQDSEAELKKQLYCLKENYRLGDEEETGNGSNNQLRD